MNLTATITAAIALISGIAGGWIYIDDRFEHRNAALFARKQIEVKIAAVDMDSEQQQIQLRLDIMEDRIWREKKKEDPDLERLDRWNTQIKRLEKRYDLIDQKRYK